MTIPGGAYLSLRYAILKSGIPESRARGAMSFPHACVYHATNGSHTTSCPYAMV